MAAMMDRNVLPFYFKKKLDIILVLPLKNNFWCKISQFFFVVLPQSTRKIQEFLF